MGEPDTKKPGRLFYECLPGIIPKKTADVPVNYSALSTKS